MGCSGELWYLKKVSGVFVEVRLVGACREHLVRLRTSKWGFV